MERLPVVLMAAALAAAALQPPAAAATLLVDGRSNIFGAGHAVPPQPGGGGAGLLPPIHAFPAGSDLVLHFASVTGTVSCCGSMGIANGADGGYYASGNSDILSTGGISGIRHGSKTMFMVGVFVDASEPVDPAPPRLDFGPAGIGESFTDLYPLLNETFFIGDGLTGTGGGAQQEFHVPPGATRLFLGFADALQFGNPTDLPGYYDDNLGSLTATFEIVSGGPTPAKPASWGRLKILYR